MTKKLDVVFTPFLFVEHVLPKGLLPNEIGAHACWYYAKCAHKNLEELEQGATYEGELDAQNHLPNLVRSISQLYAIQDPSDMLRFIPWCRAECQRLGYAWNPAVENPGAVSEYRLPSTPAKPN